jgi:hypothetical protein
MGLHQITDRGGSALQILPLTVVNGKLDDVIGTALSFNVIGDVEFGFPATGSETSDEVNEVTLINGITIRTPKITKAIDKAGNELASSAGGGSGTGHSIVVNLYEQDLDFITDMQSLVGSVFLVWFPLGDRNHDGFGWMIGRFDGEIKIKRSGNAYNSVPLTIVGKAMSLDTGVTAASMVTAITGAVASITQPGVAASAPANPLNPATNITSSNALPVAADIATPGLLAGTLLFKKGA